MEEEEVVGLLRSLASLEEGVEETTPTSVLLHLDAESN